MSDTPRTDKVHEDNRYQDSADLIRDLAELSCQLERELAVARAALKCAAIEPKNFPLTLPGDG